MDQPLSRSVTDSKRRKMLLVFTVTVSALAVSAWAINRAVRPSVKLADIRVSVVTHGGIANTINASGVVIPVHEEQVISPIQTRVAKVHVKPGQAVASGELLLELDDHTIVLAMDNLKEQIATALKEGKTNLVVFEGDKLATLGRAIEIMDIAKDAGAAKFAIATDKGN